MLEGSTTFNRDRVVGRVCYPTYGERLAKPPTIRGHSDYSDDGCEAITVKCSPAGEIERTMVEYALRPAAPGFVKVKPQRLSMDTLLEELPQRS